MRFSLVDCNKQNNWIIDKAEYQYVRKKKSFSLSIESDTFLVKETKKKKNLSFWVSTRIEKKRWKEKVTAENHQD